MFSITNTTGTWALWTLSKSCIMFYIIFFPDGVALILETKTEKKNSRDVAITCYRKIFFFLTEQQF